jgi:hypothetical protein
MDGALAAPEDHIQIEPRQMFLQLVAAAGLEQGDE